MGKEKENIMCINLLTGPVQRQKAQPLFLGEGLPITGALVSIPGILISLVLSIAKVSQAIFNAVRCSQGEERRKRITKLFQAAGDWGIILLNQIANLCTLGVLNNIIVACDKKGSLWFDPAHPNALI